MIRKTTTTLFAVTLGLAAAAPAAADTPPIAAHLDRVGHPYATQTFELGAQVLPPQSPTIAWRYRITSIAGGSVPAYTAPLECEIADNGTIRPASCGPAQPMGLQGGIAALLLRQSDWFAHAPKFPVIDRVKAGTALQISGQSVPYYADRAGGGFPPPAKPPFYRLVHLTISVPAITAPTVNLAAGPLVDRAKLPAVIAALRDGRAGIDTNDYPSGALRANISGRETAECQVQADLSLICHLAAFDPPEGAQYFADSAGDFFAGIHVDPQLAGGGSSVGARFRMAISWKIPQP